MKTNVILLCLGVFILVLSGCRKKLEDAQVAFKFEHYAGNAKITENSALMYTNAAGNYYNVTLLKYYISNIRLVKESGEEIALNNHDLIDAFGTNYTDLATVPGGDYVAVKFLFGVEPANNTSGAQSGDLNPSLGMFWSWSSGYIFSKHEGRFIDNNNVEQNLEYHLGRQQMATELEVPINTLAINGSDKEVRLRFDLNNMYNSPIIDFNLGYTTRHSSPASDTQWMDDMKANLGDVFSFLAITDL